MTQVLTELGSNPAQQEKNSEHSEHSSSHADSKSHEEKGHHEEGSHHVLLTGHPKAKLHALHDHVSAMLKDAGDNPDSSSGSDSSVSAMSASGSGSEASVERPWSASSAAKF